jgi:hypothetical protein
MKKTFAALLAVATVGGAFSVTPANAQRWVGPAIGGAVVGGIIGGAIASQAAPAPVYVAPGPYPCRWVREGFYDAYGNYRYRRVQYCD